VCQKLVGTDGDNKISMTVRRCQLQGIGACNATNEKLGINRKLDFCEECDTDGCNGSSSNHVYGMLIGVVTAMTIYLHLSLRSSF